MNSKKVLFQGDSITDAGRVRDINADTVKQLGEGYVKLISEKFEKDKKDYKIYNRGVSGDTSVLLHSRLKSDIIDIKPDILSILIGVNDVWRICDSNSGVGIEEYTKNYDDLLKQVCEALPNIKIILLEPFVVDGSGVKDYYNEFASTLKPYQKAVLELSKKYNTEFIPLQSEFNNVLKTHSVSYLIGDGVHPTQEGHKLIAERLLEVFEKF